MSLRARATEGDPALNQQAKQNYMKHMKLAIKMMLKTPCQP